MMSTARGTGRLLGLCDLWPLALLALLGAGACGGEEEGGDLGPVVRCETDNDCEEEMVNRACRRGRCQNPCPEGMTYVGAGAYTRGCDAQENSAMVKNCADNAQPPHTVTLSAGFCLSRTEVSVADFRRCVAAGACQAPAELSCTAMSATWRAQPGDMMSEALPVNCLLWTDAKAVCGFLGGRLPTEAEWEKAARGTDERRYPWGNGATAECGKGVNWGGGSDCTQELWPVGSGKGTQAQSAAKAFDMAGNVWEWTADWYSDLAYRACEKGCTDPAGPETGVVRVRRGGGYKSLKLQELRSSYREYHLPDLARSDLNGARCARSLE